MEMEDYGELLADTFGGGKPTNSPRVKYGTVTKVNGSTLDVSLAGGTITGVCMTVSCAGAKVGDRVVLLVDGALVTCLGIVATSDNARYVTSSIGDILTSERFRNAKLLTRTNIDWYMIRSHSVKLSEPISSQMFGIVLCWRAYSNGSGQRYDYAFHFIPKSHAELNSGYGVGFPLFVADFENLGAKYLYVSDDRITGNDFNNKAGTKNGVTYNNAHWVLDYVMGV